MKTTMRSIFLVLFGSAALLLAACASDNVTERTRLPYIDSPPPPQAVPPAQNVPGNEGTTTKSPEVTK